jgi:saccharopine dehydrogenase (NAD+, L-lysine-forming)
LLPLESSQRFAADLLPTLLELPNWRQNRVWADAYKLFETKLAAAAE